MTGISEILTLVLIIICLLILPRMFRGKPTSSKPFIKKKISALLRAAIVLSIIIPIVAALILKPWTGNITLFIAFGILPVAVGWALFWVFSGSKK